MLQDTVLLRPHSFAFAQLLLGDIRSEYGALVDNEVTVTVGSLDSSVPVPVVDPCTWPAAAVVINFSALWTLNTSAKTWKTTNTIKDTMGRSPYAKGAVFPCSPTAPAASNDSWAYL